MPQNKADPTKKTTDWREKSFIQAVTDIIASPLGQQYTEMLWKELYADQEFVSAKELARSLAFERPRAQALVFIMEAAVNNLPVSVMMTVKEQALTRFEEYMANELRAEKVRDRMGTGNYSNTSLDFYLKLGEYLLTEPGKKYWSELYETIEDDGSSDYIDSFIEGYGAKVLADVALEMLSPEDQAIAHQKAFEQFVKDMEEDMAEGEDDEPAETV